MKEMKLKDRDKCETREQGKKKHLYNFMAVRKCKWKSE